MTDSEFWFVIVLIAAGFFLMFFIEWLYRKTEPHPSKEEQDKHNQLMKEIEKH